MVDTSSPGGYTKDNKVDCSKPKEKGEGRYGY